MTTSDATKAGLPYPSDLLTGLCTSLATAFNGCTSAAGFNGCASVGAADEVDVFDSSLMTGLRIAVLATTVVGEL